MTACRSASKVKSWESCVHLMLSHPTRTRSVLRCTPLLSRHRKWKENGYSRSHVQSHTNSLYLRGFLLAPLRVPSPLPRQDRWNSIRSYRPIDCGLPLKTGGSALALVVRGLLSVYSRYGLHARQVAIATLYTEGSSGFVTSAAASIAIGWSEPVLGRVCLPLWTNAFSRRTIFGNLRDQVPRLRASCRVEDWRHAS
jgi:hypothetical protein